MARHPYTGLEVATRVHYGRRVSSLLRRRAPSVESLTDASRRELLRFVDTDPIVNAAVGTRLRQFGTIDAGTFGGHLLGVRDSEGGLSGVAFHGGNLLPIGGGPDDWLVLAGHLAQLPRICSSIIGRAEAVMAMWPMLARSWGPARAMREMQPLLVLDRAAAPRFGDPRVRPMRPSELDRYLPASVAMFTEELGISPYESTNAPDYRRRVAGLIDEGRAFGIVDGDGEVIFKADIGVVSLRTCQVQGVWLRPDLRGRGTGGAALAAVVRHALTLAPTVSLYVNHFNVPARRMYARLGMREVATLSTILF